MIYMAGIPRDPNKYKLDPSKQHLVLNNQRLINKVIRDHFSVYTEDNYSDMFQEGIIGLIKAVAKYREDGAAKFSSYAYFCIKNEIQKFVSERTDNVKVPVTVRMCIDRLSKIGVSVHEVDINNENHKAILKKYQTTAAAVQSGHKLGAITSLDKPIEGTEDLTLSDVIVDPDSMIDKDLDDIAEKYIDRKFVSDLHTWLNFNHPDNLFHNRIYVNYIYWHDKLPTISKRFAAVTKELNVSRTIIKAILPIYNEYLIEFMASQKTT